MEHLKKENLNFTDLMEGISKSEVITTENLQILRLTIKPGHKLAPHDMPSKVVFSIQKGIGTFHYGDDITTANIGDFIHVNPGKLRFWENKHSEDLELLVIKSLKETI